jgi:quercetin dioxygenase-like cupin family protein
MRSESIVHRWDEIGLEKVTELISRKIVVGDRQMVAQVYLKRGAQVPVHAHESEQLVYVLKGALRCRVGDEPLTVREGEVLHVPSGVRHQAEAIEDTFELAMFSPIREEWLPTRD